MKIIEVIHAYGHGNVQSTHKTTFQITKETFLSQRGDCVIAVAASKSVMDLSSKFKETIRREKARVTTIIEVDNVKEVARAKGSPRLTFTHPNDLVVRKSSYVCGRTLAINADKAACDFSKKLVKKLQDPKQGVKITLIAETATCQV